MDNLFLYVQLIVPKSRARAFERASRPVVRDRFKSLMGPEDEPFKLYLALKGVEPFMYRFDGRVLKSKNPTAAMVPSVARAFRSVLVGKLTPALRYIHVWELPQDGADRLSKIMLAAGEDKNYGRVDKEVARESQDIIRLVKTGDGLPELNPGGTFVRRTRVFKSQDVDPYLFSSGTLLPTLEEVGWHNLGQFQTTTGRLNSVIEFWQTGAQQMRALANAPLLTRPFTNLLARKIPGAVSESQEAFVLAPYHS